MKQTLTWLACCLLGISCNNSNENKKGSSERDDEAPVQCFAYANSRDTIILKLIPMGETVTGTLEYVLDGKDRNTGTIKGVVRDNLLVADYTFMSEGLRSVRQIAFQKRDSFYIEGYGDIESEGNRSRFRNTDSLWYNDSIRLMPEKCEK